MHIPHLTQAADNECSLAFMVNHVQGSNVEEAVTALLVLSLCFEPRKHHESCDLHVVGNGDKHKA